jgi:hypothetical protein
MLICTALPAGCIRVDAKAPRDISWGAPPPPASIPRADPTSKADLLRENQQLRDRVAWLENQSRKSAGKHREQEGDKQEIRADMAKLAAERDRYQRAAGQ